MIIVLDIIIRKRRIRGCKVEGDVQLNDKPGVQEEQLTQAVKLVGESQCFN